MAVSVYDGTKWIKLGAANIRTSSGWQALHPEDKFYFGNSWYSLGADCVIFQGTLESLIVPGSQDSDGSGGTLCHFHAGTGDLGTLRGAHIVDGRWETTSVKTYIHPDTGVYAVDILAYRANTSYPDVTIALWGNTSGLLSKHFYTSLTRTYPK